MSELCKACGAAVPEDAYKCEYCGTAVIKKTNRFCRICGTPYGEGVRFCRKCGTLTGRPQSTKADPSSAPLANRRPTQTVRGKASVSAPVMAIKKKSPFTVILVSLLLFALVIAAVTAGISRCGDDSVNTKNGLTNITYSEKELSAPGTKVSVSPDTHAVQAGEVALDFGPFNLYGESTVEVKELPQKTDSRTGVTVKGYDFSLVDDASGEVVSEFPTLIDVTVPCTASLNEYAFIQHYDPETDQWRIIDSVRDYENNTLTFQTTHFSVYGESKIVLGSEYSVGENGETMIPSQSFAYVGGYNGPLTEVYFVSADLDRFMASIDFEKLKEILKSCKVYPHDMATALMGLGNDAANVLDLKATNTLINTMMRADTGLEKWAKSIKLVGSALVFAKVAYQLYMGGEIETVAYINAVNLTETLLTVAGLALGSEALLMMATVVFLSNTVYSLATLEMTTIQEQGYINFNDGLGAVFFAESMNVTPRDMPSLSQAYYAPSGPIILDRGGKGFARALDAIYDHYYDKPADLQKAVDKLINGYVNCFWDSKQLTDQDRVRYAYYHEKYDENNPPRWIQPSAEAIQGYKDKFREKLMSDIKPLMKEFAERVLHDLKLKLRDTIEKEYVPFLNTVVTVQAGINSLAPANTTFDKTVYARDYDMRFSPELTPYWVSADDYIRDYRPRVRTDSDEIYKSTVYNFLQIGDPAEIEFMDESGTSDDFYAPIDWTAFPAGKIAVTPKQDDMGSIAYYDNADVLSSDYEKDMGRLLLQKGRIKLTADQKGICKLQASGTVTEKSDPPSDPTYYTTESSTIQSGDLTIDFGLGEGDVCNVSGSIVRSAVSEDVEKDSGDFWSVEEYWISESSASYTVKGMGKVSYRTTYDDEYGTIRLMVLSFDSVQISGNGSYKLTYKYITGNDSRSEIKDDTSTPINETDSLVLEFIVD